MSVRQGCAHHATNAPSHASFPVRDRHRAGPSATAPLAPPIIKGVVMKISRFARRNHHRSGATPSSCGLRWRRAHRPAGVDHAVVTTPATVTRRRKPPPAPSPHRRKPPPAPSPPIPGAGNPWSEAQSPTSDSVTPGGMDDGPISAGLTAPVTGFPRTRPSGRLPREFRAAAMSGLPSVRHDLREFANLRRGSNRECLQGRHHDREDSPVLTSWHSCRRQCVDAAVPRRE